MQLSTGRTFALFPGHTRMYEACPESKYNKGLKHVQHF